MKLILILLIMVSFINWEPNFDTAKQTAKNEHKLILLNFSGSDWCGPCILMRRDYLENSDFTAMANDNLVLVNADFPRKKKNQQSDEIIKRNDQLAETYNKAGNFPFTLLLDENGKVLKTWLGKPEISPEKWTEQIKNVCLGNR